MEFLERHDLRKIHYLNSLTFSKLKPYLGNVKNDDERKIEFDGIKHFCHAVIKSRGEVRRAYAYSLSTPLETGGRLYCGLSAQGLPKVIRGFLMTHTTDIDMKNCHPTILYYLCRKHKLECPNLEYYIQHRDEVLAKFQDRDTAKDLFNSAVNNDKKNYKEKNAFFRNFDTEMKTLQPLLTQMDEYLAIRSSVPDDKKIRNWDGSALNRIMCMYENRILAVAMSVCNRLNIEIACPMFDGFMAYGQHDTSLLREIETAVEERFPGLAMMWDTKPHKDDLHMPDDFKIPEKMVDHSNEKIAQNDLEAGELIYLELKDILLYSKGSFYYKKYNLWTQDIEEIRSSIRHYVMKAEIYKLDQWNELQDYSQNIQKAANITTCVLDIVLAHKNDNWVNQLFHSSLGYVLFNNGYWDCRRGLFHVTGSALFDSSILFTEKIPFDYDTAFDDQTYIERLRKLFFTDPFGEPVGSYYLLQLARALAGDCMKRFLVGVGSSNTGKSMITSALGSACGGYFEGWTAGNLVYKQSSQDEAQQQRWLYLLRTKRIIVSNELKSTTTIDGNMMKKMSNGGLDPLTGRLHGGNETIFKVCFLPILFAQDLPPIKPIDDAIMTRVRAIPYTKVYVDEPSHCLELKKEPHLEDEIHTYAFQMGFLRLMFQSYLEFHQSGRVEVELEEVKQAVLDVVGHETNIMDAFLNRYEITNDPEDSVSSATLQQWLTDEKKGVTITKLGLELNRYAQIHKMEHVKHKDKKVNKRVSKHWMGVREMTDD